MYDTFIDTSASTTQANNRLRQEYIRLYLIFLPGSNNKKNSQSTDQVVLLITTRCEYKMMIGLQIKYSLFNNKRRRSRKNNLKNT